MTTLPGKKVAVLGLGQSGYESAKFLHAQSCTVFVSESTHSEKNVARAEDLRQKGIEVEIGSHSFDCLAKVDWVLISPGISPRTPVYRFLFEKKIPIYSEIEVASWFSRAKNVIAITGTAGKTTVATLLGSVLKQKYGEEKVQICGNIGTPWIGCLDQIQSDSYVVLEVSSFQLATCEKFKPHIAVLLNLSPNHLDWHQDMGEYVQCKLKLFSNQTQDDVRILQKKDEEEYFKNVDLKSSCVYFGGEEGINPNEEVIKKVAELCGCDEQLVKDALQSFEGLEHRLEEVADIQGVRFVNDSKCTTPDSLRWALEKYGDQKVLLIAGGKAKSRDFEKLQSSIQRKVKAAAVYGEASPLLKEAWANSCPLQEVADLEKAIEYVFEKAEPGDVVLLSPACASFDMFQNYQERGCSFKDKVKTLASAMSR